MPPAATPPLSGLAIRVWVDAFRAVAAMPVVAGIGIGLLIALGLASDLLPPLFRSGQPETLGQSLMWSGAAGMVESFLLAPLAIAIQRHVLLGEVTRGYSLALSDPRFLRFFYFSFTLALAQTILFFVATLVLPAAFNAPANAAEPNGTGVTITAGIIVGVLLVLARLILVFPAAAVDAPGATWGNAWRASRGHFWTIAFVFILTGLPALLLWLLIGQMLGIKDNSNFSQTYFMLQEMPTLCAYAAAAARLYQVFGGALGDSPGKADGNISVV